MEIKHSRIGEALGAIEQGVNRGYAYLKLAARSNSNKALMIGMNLYPTEEEKSLDMGDIKAGPDKQVTEYVDYTKYMTSSDRAITVAMHSKFTDNGDIDIIIHSGGRIRHSTSLVSDSHYIVGAVDEAFHGNYERLVRLTATLSAYHFAPTLGNVMVDHIVPKLSKQLSKFYPFASEAIATTVLQRMSRFIRGAPTGILNIIDIGLSTRDLVHHINETIETWDNKDWAEKSGQVIRMCVDVCNIATNGAQLVIMVTGQVEAEPFVAAIQVGCLWAGYMNENFLEIWDIRKDIDVSAWEIAKGFVPISAINNKDQLRTDQTVKRIYEQFLIETEILNYYDGVITSLYDVTLEEEGNLLDDELIEASQFVDKQRFHYSAPMEKMRSIYVQLNYNATMKQ
ncbi:hypothetical protein Ddc_21343 [Ditylenchus destructor]|nr:hypothetical protein Ddc_21343 [Ditylenchus destructor]